MKYNREVRTLQNQVQAAWQGIRASLRQMHPSTTVQPGDATAIFRPDSESEDPKFNIGPVVFGVPERAKDRNSDLHVVIQGWITFGPVLDMDPRRTTLRFGTQVGYFREKEDQLFHVYGIHYDMDEHLPGHPVFHAQMSTQASLAPVVEEYTNLHFHEDRDLSRGLLRNVRTPTAQMDAFAVITQIGADHLMSEKSSAEVQAAFGRLRAACDFFVGAGARIGYLNSTVASHCYRSTHWYTRGAVHSPQDVDRMRLWRERSASGVKGT